MKPPSPGGVDEDAHFESLLEEAGVPDEEIRASFDVAGGVGAGFADLSTPGSVHVLTGVNADYEMEDIPIPQTVPMPVAAGFTTSGVRSWVRRDRHPTRALLWRKHRII
jgi:hypothetical protein